MSAEDFNRPHGGRQFPCNRKARNHQRIIPDYKTSEPAAAKVTPL